MTNAPESRVSAARAKFDRTPDHPGVLRYEWDEATARRITTEHSQEWNDWTGVQWDFLRVMEVADVMIPRMQARKIPDISDSDYDRVIDDSLIAAGLIAYARPFSRGVRVNIKLDLTVLATMGDSPAIHQHLLDLRNKYIAHSANDFEQNITLAVLAKPPLDPSLLRTTHIHYGVSPVNLDGFRMMRSIAKVLYDQTVDNVARLAPIVEAEGAALDLDELYRLPELTIPLPSVKGASKQRKP